MEDETVRQDEPISVRAGVWPTAPELHIEFFSFPGRREGAIRRADKMMG
jgi:hypothetical protein